MNKIKKLIYITILILTFSIPVHSKTPFVDYVKKVPPKNYVPLYIHTSYHNLNFSSINKYLSNSGLAYIEKNFYNVGFGVSSIKNKVLLGLYYGFYFPKNNVSTINNIKYTANLKCDQVFFNIGYNILNLKYFQLIPAIGIGRGSMIYSIINNKDYSINNLFDDPEKVIYLTYNDWLVNISADLTYRLGNELGLFLSVTPGYIYTPLNNNWKLIDKDLSSNLGNFNGFYIAVRIGYYGGNY